MIKKINIYTNIYLRVREGGHKRKIRNTKRKSKSKREEKKGKME